MYFILIVLWSFLGIAPCLETFFLFKPRMNKVELFNTFS